MFRASCCHVLWSRPWHDVLSPSGKRGHCHLTGMLWMCVALHCSHQDSLFLCAFLFLVAHGLWFDLSLWFSLTGSCVWEKGICWHWELAITRGLLPCGSALVLLYSSLWDHFYLYGFSPLLPLMTPMPTPFSQIEPKLRISQVHLLHFLFEVQRHCSVSFVSYTHPLGLHCFLTLISPFQFHTPFYITYNIATFWLASDHISDRYYFTFWCNNHCDV